ncbi:MAG: threonine/serine exporter family protein [Fusobacteriaceae bacterium]
MDKFPLYLHFLMSAIATGGFAVFINCPKLDVIISSIIGGLGWVAYRSLYLTTGEVIFPYFFATMVIGALASIISNRNRKPTIIYIIPGVIPLVPGYNMYYTMLYLVTQKYDLALKNLLDSIFIAFAIASGLLFTESLRKIVNTVLEKGLKRKINVKDEDTIS